MYEIEWDKETRGYLLKPGPATIQREIRPVYTAELNLLGFDKYWDYDKESTQPLLWCDGPRRYYYNGELAAVVVGGSLNTAPVIDIRTADLKIVAPDINLMVKKNSKAMNALEQKALEFIDNTFNKYKNKVDAFVCAYSGGKDSAVLLDLCRRALSPKDFVVVFGDTGMELPSTYEAVADARKRYPELNFHTARAEKPPETTWKEFGPPSRVLRWCCSVHKSAPTILKLREILGRTNIKVVVFDGVRSEESEARSDYDEFTLIGKHQGQSNASPILKWNAAELFLYIFKHSLDLNLAYLQGMTRVGCSVCPMASDRWYYLANKVAPNAIKPFIEQIATVARDNNVTEIEIPKYLESGNWVVRSGGRGLVNAEHKVLVFDEENKLSFQIRKPELSWRDVMKIFSCVLREDGGELIILDQSINMSCIENGENLNISFNISKKSIKIRALLRKIINKITYCVSCKVCEAECVFGALTVSKGKFIVDEKKCKRCAACLNFTDRGCVAAKSLWITEGGTMKKLTGVNKYQHFGLRKDWIELFFEKGDEFWGLSLIGNRQYDAMKPWLKEAGLTDNNKINSLSKALEIAGSDSDTTWQIIWINIAYNSVLVNWYVTKVGWLQVFDKKHLIELMGDELSEKTRENAITSLVELLKFSPLGDMGFGVIEFASDKRRVVKSIEKSGCNAINNIALVYALYKYAEVSDRFDITLTELMTEENDNKALGLMQLFGKDKAYYKKTLVGAALEYPHSLVVEFNADLDNISLNRELTAGKFIDSVFKK